MASLENVLLGEYRVVERIGAGGMGEVYRAVHTHLGRVIAVKVLHPGLADGATLQRFYGEAGIQASLNHPGVAEYLGFFETDGRPCILMEYVDGETLSAAIERRGPLPPWEAVKTLRECAAVAAHFHAQGVVHRDLKSSNVKINSAGQVKVLDFGIARRQHADRLTQTGAVIGTPDALAPEQLRGEAVTPATDVWQLGIMLYELLSRQSPFHAGSTSETYARIMFAEAPPVSAPPALAAVVARCLQKDPAKRFASGAELYQALQVLEHPAQPPRRRLGLVAGIAAAAVLAVLAGVAALRNGREPPAPPAAVAAPAQVITIDTMDGVAHVYRDGKQVGSTPFQVPARTGERVNLVLRREGFADSPVQFEAAEPHVYTFALQPLKGR